MTINQNNCLGGAVWALSLVHTALVDFRLRNREEVMSPDSMYGPVKDRIQKYKDLVRIKQASAFKKDMLRLDDEYHVATWDGNIDFPEFLNTRNEPRAYEFNPRDERVYDPLLRLLNRELLAETGRRHTVTDGLAEDALALFHFALLSLYREQEEHGYTGTLDAHISGNMITRVNESFSAFVFFYDTQCNTTEFFRDSVRKHVMSLEEQGQLSLPLQK